MLELKNLTFNYDKVPVLEDISVQLNVGKVYGILGPNGAGKTTLFEVIAGRQSLQDGVLNYQGESISIHDIGYLETVPYFYPRMTGAEYLQLHQVRNPDFKIDEWNEIFNLPLYQLVDSYSSGMKKKLAIMGMICLDRPIMLLDEPFNNLDLEANQFVAQLLRLLADKGKIIVLSSHFVEVLTTVCDTIYPLQNGQLGEPIERSNFEQWKEKYRKSEVEEAINLADKLL
ncbi:ABC transporter ATP-binding protein [Fodinibius halophilus]|uniref:ATP-binding cassette domain-containing protein n=1 Tax=Fodinibius halophilus TaxID=1736908 RepID=A0A6M1T645_9BACT|nr:ATP-binding cassette domain-containing protein [Fodinibius halophilus]NGP89587.1 ATP-binding cassette domain-containing protein [Fodinibius halophilus]